MSKIYFGDPKAHEQGNVRLAKELSRDRKLIKKSKDVVTAYHYITRELNENLRSVREGSLKHFGINMDDLLPFFIRKRHQGEFGNVQLEYPFILVVEITEGVRSRTLIDSDEIIYFKG